LAPWKPHGYVGQECRKCSWRAYLGAYLRIPRAHASATLRLAGARAARRAVVARLLGRGPEADAEEKPAGQATEPLPRPAGSYVLVRLGGNLHARLFNLLVGRGFEVLEDLAEQKECGRP